MYYIVQQFKQRSLLNLLFSGALKWLATVGPFKRTIYIQEHLMILLIQKADSDMYMFFPESSS